MSVTTVPLRPTRRRVLVMLWLGIAAAILAAVGLAWTTTSATVARSGTADQFLAWNAGQPGVVTTESGLQYQVLEPGEGEGPTMADVALVNYSGALRDGTVFDQQERAPFPLGQVVPGFAEGMAKMGRGARHRLWIPPALGYGDTDTGGAIPAGSVLIFEVEMLDFLPLETLQQMQSMQGMPGGMPGTPGAGAPPPPGPPPAQ